MALGCSFLASGSVVVNSLLTLVHILCLVLVLLCFVLQYFNSVLSRFAIILMGERAGCFFINGLPDVL